MTALRVMIGMTLSMLMLHSTALAAQQWTEGTIVDRNLTGFKKHPFTLRLDAFRNLGYRC
mgnify:FL=1